MEISLEQLIFNMKLQAAILSKSKNNKSQMLANSITNFVVLLEPDKNSSELPAKATHAPISEEK